MNSETGEVQQRLQFETADIANFEVRIHGSAANIIFYCTLILILMQLQLFLNILQYLYLYSLSGMCNFSAQLKYFHGTSNGFYKEPERLQYFYALLNILIMRHS